MLEGLYNYKLSQVQGDIISYLHHSNSKSIKHQRHLLAPTIGPGPLSYSKLCLRVAHSKVFNNV